MEIKKERLEELLKAEQKLSALEIVGVDDWSGYSIAMDNVKRQNEKSDKIRDAVAKVMDILQGSLYEPSVHGAGYSITEEAGNEAEQVLLECVNELINE